MHAKRPVIIANIPKLPAKWAGIIMPLLRRFTAMLVDMPGAPK